MKCTVTFESAFMEEAVFLAIRSLETAGEETTTQTFHRHKDQIYEGNGGETAFQELNEKFFRQLGLRSVFESLISEFPNLDHSHMAIFVRRAYGRRQEGSELYSEGDSKTVLLSLQTKRVLERSRLEALVRHELLRASDMLDPHFQYSPTAVLGGSNEVEEHLIRDRFGLLWDFYIDVRLGQKGFEMADPETNGMPPGWARGFDEIRRPGRWTQGALLKLARGEPSSRMIRGSL